MTVALAGRAPATFEIKSATLPLVALLLKSPDLALLEEELRARFGELPEFFDQDPMVVDLTPLAGAGDIEFDKLIALLRGYRVKPVAVRGGSEQQMEAAIRSGLAAAPDVRTTNTAPAPVVHQPSSALVVDKPLRSGQQVYAKGRDLVVLSMVNPGAEVIADGHIHVYAPLRGKAIAGARGDAKARILSLCLEAELLSIAGVYRTTETELPAAVRGKPAQIRLVDDKLVMDPLNP
jgi:septum site-determining protein MinC